MASCWNSGESLKLGFSVASVRGVDAKSLTLSGKWDERVCLNLWKHVVLNAIRNCRENMLECRKYLWVSVCLPRDALRVYLLRPSRVPNVMDDDYYSIDAILASNQVGPLYNCNAQLTTFRNFNVSLVSTFLVLAIWMVAQRKTYCT